jgi:hypothetical protein
MMSESVIGGYTYRIGKLSARDQFHVIRKLAPLMGSLGNASKTGTDAEALVPIATALGEMSDDAADSILFELLKVASRKLENGIGWAPVSTGKQLMYADLPLADMLQIAWAVFQENFAGFLQGLHGAGSQDSPAPSGQ